MTKKAAKRPAHRPRVLSPELTEEICTHIRAAFSLAEAARKSGVGVSTVYRWMDEGEDRPGPEREFREQVQAAQRKRVQALKDRWIELGRRDFKGVDRVLQVLEPKEFAPRLRVHLEEEFSRAVTRIEAAFAGEPEVLDRVLAALADERGEASAAPAAGGEDGGGDGGGGGSSEAVPAPQPE